MWIWQPRASERTAPRSRLESPFFFTDSLFMTGNVPNALPNMQRAVKEDEGARIKRFNFIMSSVEIKLSL